MELIFLSTTSDTLLDQVVLRRSANYDPARKPRKSEFPAHDLATIESRQAANLIHIDRDRKSDDI